MTIIYDLDASSLDWLDTKLVRLEYLLLCMVVLQSLLLIVVGIGELLEDL